MQLKVMLVDDELLVRLGIKSLIEWDKHGFLFAGDAPDGQKALDMMEQELGAPDILLTDIVMPNMNGLELIEQVKRKYPETRILVLSSHNEFDYVRRAMKLGVDDYIWKTSLKPDELLALLLEMAEKIKAERQARMQRFEETADESESVRSVFSTLLLKHLEHVPLGEDELQQQSRVPLPTQSILAVLKLHLGSEGMPVVPPVKTLAHLIELELGKWQGGWAVPHREREIIVWISGEGTPGPDWKSIAQDLISSARRFLNVSLSAGLSGPFASWNEVGPAYEQARGALQRFFYEGHGNVYAYSEPPPSASDAHAYSKDQEQKLLLELERMDADELRHAVRERFERMRAARIPIERFTQLCLQMLHLIQKNWQAFGGEAFADLEAKEPLYKQVLAFETWEEAREWFDGLIAAGERYSRKAGWETTRDDIKRLLLYMKQHYTEDLSLKWAAELANMSESHLSSVFKKETGISFTECLNRLRVDKAAQLLLETNLPSYLIAEQVGYENINYFGRVFKKLNGLSPQQYRAKHQKPM